MSLSVDIYERVMDTLEKHSLLENRILTLQDAKKLVANYDDVIVNALYEKWIEMRIAMKGMVSYM